MEYLLFFLEAAAALALAAGVYFFLVTRGTLIFESLRSSKDGTAHIYWIYRNRFLIWLTDRPFIISAILLFNYRRLVDDLVRDLNPSLEGKSVLQSSCAFGDISQKIAAKCHREGAKRLVISDLVATEIRHSRKKLAKAATGQSCLFVRENAAALAYLDRSFDYVVIFFLFHELPLHLKYAALKEAARVLKPGGKIVFGEFHKPGPWLLRASGKLFFKVFEPYAREMWDGFDPVKVLNEDAACKWEFSKKTYFGGNYQLFSAEKIS
ncbi:MAG: class I SAM-dependent methyltransferase [Deltaproteobacteria bacterium]|nr:class I SAM-dependent methyltransferase [Deltaproteobacteria bacterium]